MCYLNSYNKGPPLHTYSDPIFIFMDPDDTTTRYVLVTRPFTMKAKSAFVAFVERDFRSGEFVVGHIDCHYDDVGTAGGGLPDTFEALIKSGV